MKTYHDKKFPNESEAYREARNELLEAEINLRRQTEEVAAMRRTLPNGGKLKEDYVFEEIDADGNIKQTKLSDLFEPGKDSLIIYSFMFGPQNEKPCVMCNSIIDGINGMVFHAEQRVNIAVVAKTSIEKLKQWADSRGWKNVRLLSSAKNNYNRDYFGEDEKLNQWPALNVFGKTDEEIFISMHRNFYLHRSKKDRMEGTLILSGHSGIFLTLSPKEEEQTGTRGMTIKIKRLKIEVPNKSCKLF